jgi:hypothetical protein
MGYRVFGVEEPFQVCEPSVLGVLLPFQEEALESGVFLEPVTRDL